MRPTRPTPCVGSPVTAKMLMIATMPRLSCMPRTSIGINHTVAACHPNKALCLNLAGAPESEQAILAFISVSHGTLPRPSRRLNISHFGSILYLLHHLAVFAGIFCITNILNLTAILALHRHVHSGVLITFCSKQRTWPRLIIPVLCCPSNPMHVPLRHGTPPPACVTIARSHTAPRHPRGVPLILQATKRSPKKKATKRSQKKKAVASNVSHLDVSQCGSNAANSSRG